jgi:hypothetical protein
MSWSSSAGSRGPSSGRCRSRWIWFVHHDAVAALPRPRESLQLLCVRCGAGLFYVRHHRPRGVREHHYESEAVLRRQARAQAERGSAMPAGIASSSATTVALPSGRRPGVRAESNRVLERFGKQASITQEKK